MEKSPNNQIDVTNVPDVNHDAFIRKSQSVAKSQKEIDEANKTYLVAERVEHYADKVLDFSKKHGPGVLAGALITGGPTAAVPIAGIGLLGGVGIGLVSNEVQKIKRGAEVSMSFSSEDKKIALEAARKLVAHEEEIDVDVARREMERDFKNRSPNNTQ